jgi:hypothetical protein
MCKGHFTLWPSKSRGRGIEWLNVVESPKKWVANSHPIKYIRIGAFGRA